MHYVESTAAEEDADGVEYEPLEQPAPSTPPQQPQQQPRQQQPLERSKLAEAGATPTVAAKRLSLPPMQLLGRTVPAAGGAAPPDAVVMPYSWPELREKLLDVTAHAEPELFALPALSDLWSPTATSSAWPRLQAVLCALGQHTRADELLAVAAGYVDLAVERVLAAPANVEVRGL
jgi:hypothetical protein